MILISKAPFCLHKNALMISLLNNMFSKILKALLTLTHAGLYLKNLPYWQRNIKGSCKGTGIVQSYIFNAVLHVMFHEILIFLPPLKLMQYYILYRP